jgi:hypothetical protein
MERQMEIKIKKQKIPQSDYDIVFFSTLKRRRDHSYLLPSLPVEPNAPPTTLIGLSIWVWICLVFPW